MQTIQHTESDNYLSGLHTLTKLTITLFFSVFIVFIKEQSAIIFLFIVSCLYIIPIKRYKLMLIGYGLTLVMFGISLICSYLLSLMASKFGSKGNFVMLVPFLRVGLMTNLMLSLILSSGEKKMVNVLKALRLPRFLFLPTLVVFRFVPAFINDIKQIHEGIKLKIGHFKFYTPFFKPVLFFRLLMIPSVITALRSADALSVAAELKGLSGCEKITNSKPEKWRWQDAATLLFAALTTTTSIYIEKGGLL